MSTSIPPVNQDEDGPEEGEIEDDEDDIIFLNSSSPQRSSTTSTSLDLYASPSPARKTSYERDIRHFEVRRARTTQRRASGSKSSYYVGSSASTRNKSKHSRTGLTQGKENRHVHRHKSPVHIHHHRKESKDRTLADFKDLSPVRRDSSHSSIESEDRTTGRSSHHRSTRRCSTKFDRAKRKSSSSPERDYIPSKRRAHHSEKCPLMKVLHSVAKETRLIALENSESQSESSSLRQRLLNMGAMPAVHEEAQSSSKEINVCNLEAEGIEDSRPSSVNSTLNEDTCKIVQSESTQTEEVTDGTHADIKAIPEIVVLTDSEETTSNELESTVKSVSNCLPNQSELAAKANPSEPSKVATSCSMATSECDDDADDDDDDDDDIRRLRFLALQSKKNEPTSIEDADVLELRLAALKTAFMKKFRIRKKITTKINSKPSKEDPLSPLDEIPIPFSSASPDEVMTPVDMELAETDDEAASVHSIPCYSPSDPIPDCYSPSDPVPGFYSPSDPYPECYSPSDPTGSPTLEPSLQDLLPPPPPPDLDLFFPDQNFDSSLHCISEENLCKTTNFDCEPTSDIAPPPLPPYFQNLLSENSECSENISVAANEGRENFEHEECHELEVIPGSLEILGDSLVANSSNVAVTNGMENVQTDEPLPVFKNHEILPPCETNQKMDTPEAKEIKLAVEKTKPLSLEEEEKMLRQRLLLNMAIKREKLLKLNCDKKELSSASGKSPETLPKIASVKSTKVESGKRINGCVATTKIPPSIAVESSTVNLRSSPALVSNASVEKRFIINLADDSDSCEDYSEAESLGLKCSRNMEKWLKYLKELEVNAPKKMSPGNKIANAAGKAPSGISTKVRHSPKDNTGKKPFAENLADLESSVERFLKGVRSSHEAISKTSRGSPMVSSSVTPVAVRHLPASQQEEYRRLKQQIVKLEKQRQMSIELKKRGSLSISIGTQISLSTNVINPKQITKNPSQVIPSSKIPKVLPDISKKDSKSFNSASLATHTFKQAAGVATATSLKLLEVTPQSSLKKADIKVAREVPVLKSTSALANVSNISVVSPTNTIIHTVQSAAPKLLQKANNFRENVNLQNRLGLSSLEATLITERSCVLGELSALAKLLSQVDKSLEAQSHTANEVSSLLDQLYLATGRWKAQNGTVTGLVKKVAQRQKELSLRHRRCLIASKSCAQLGGQLIGKQYRIPTNKADAMRVRLKQVHEKTQNLAKRKTAEQARRNILEKRAEHCLVKLFLDSNPNIVARPSVTKSMEEESSNPIQAPTVPPCKVNVEKPSGSPVVQGVQLISKPVVSSILAPNKLNNGAVKCTQVSSSLISRAVGCRFALNRVRSAKAVLNLANKKRLSWKRSEIKHWRSTQLDCRQDLSDMDISTDGEEAEKGNRDQGGNREDVDMSISPATSSSSSGITKNFRRDSPQSSSLKNTHPNTKTTKVLTSSEQSSKGCPGATKYVHASDRFVPPSALGFPPLCKEPVAHLAEFPKSQVQVKAQKCESIISSRSVLKDYVSPLGGLHVLSNNSSSSSCQVKKKTSEGDLYAILCPYDLNGKCQDSDCPYKHQHQI